ncbi:MAG: TIGR02466 family protein [Gammaproteobacteria bacterium]|nr:TIGR02466 family protein [Gammaproteobacteria bacterium]
MKSDVYMLFPTPVIRVPATIENYDTVQIEVKNAIDTITKSGDTSTVTYNHKSKKETPMGEKTYNFIEKYDCKNLKLRINEAIQEYFDNIGWQGGKETVIKNSWINLADTDEENTQHSHPGYSISGTYYFRISEEQGPIAFYNPNNIVYACEFPQSPVSPQTINVVPDDGDILLFPSWLNHSVRKNKSQEQRVSVAFNIDIISSNDIAYGLAKESHIPSHRVERSFKGMNK